MTTWILGVLVGCGKPAPPVAAEPPTPEGALEAFYQEWEVELPVAPEGPPLPAVANTFVFGSCLQSRKPAPILGAMVAQQADVGVFLGDNVYGDARLGDVRLPELREVYELLATHPDFVPLAKGTPLLVTWDDHDYGMNDAGASFSAKRFSERVFETFWRIPESDPRRSRPGVYAVHTFGEEGRRVQVVLLDTRSFKSAWKPTDALGSPGKERYVPSGGGEMLGEAQWRWLEATLASPADLRIVVSSLQVHADGHGWERWGLFPEERDRLYRVLAQRSGGDVVLISGDRHRAGLYARADLPGGPYPELTTSSLNLAFDGEEEAGPHRMGDTYRGENFGRLDIDWTARTVQLAVLDASAKVVLSHEVTLTDP